MALRDDAMFSSELIKKQGVIQIRNEAKWRTTQACEKFDSDPILTVAAKNIRNRMHNEHYSGQDVYNDCAVLLNYFDSLAIGVEQGLYYEDIVRDHYETVVVGLYDDLLVGAEKPTRLGPADFPSLANLVGKWSRRTTRFVDQRE